MKNLTRTALFSAIVFALGSCGDNSKVSRDETASDSSTTSMVVADPSATSLIKRGMVIVQDTPRKLKGAEGEKDAIYRFHPFDNNQQRLRLTTADNNAGKGISEDQEIDLSPYVNKMIEVQGSSFTNRWVFNAKINGVLVTDSAAAAQAASDSARLK